MFAIEAECQLDCSLQVPFIEVSRIAVGSVAKSSDVEIVVYKCWNDGFCWIGYQGTHIPIYVMVAEKWGGGGCRWAIDH
jgi:hypothetical protein